MANWAETVSNGNVAYTATGTLYLKTAALGSAGEIALQVASGQNFKVNTHTSGQVQLGELTGVTGKFGLSLAPVAGVIKSTFGLDVSNQSVLSGWTIRTARRSSSNTRATCSATSRNCSTACRISCTATRAR